MSLPSAATDARKPARPRRSGSGRPLLWFLGKRLAASLLVLFGITLIAFILTQMVPGDPALANLGRNATQEQIDNYHEVHGLNDPLPVQYGSPPALAYCQVITETPTWRTSRRSTRRPQGPRRTIQRVFPLAE